MTWTPAQRAVAAALLFLAAAVLAGVSLVEGGGVEYRAFGLVEGLFALLLSHLLILRGAWMRPEGPAGWTAVAYGTVASAQVLELLFPPPGLIEWVVVAAMAVTAWGALAAGTRRRMVISLGTLAILLALIKFSVIPVLWERVGPAPGTGFGLGDMAEGVRRVFADHRPLRPVGQLVGFVAICLWALATRVLWVEDPAEAPVRIASQSPAPVDTAADRTKD
jgi:hypothetical protein